MVVMEAKQWVYLQNTSMTRYPLRLGSMLSQECQVTIKGLFDILTYDYCYDLPKCHEDAI